MSLHAPALEGLRHALKSATSSMTSVPKPLKYLKEYLSLLKTIHANMLPSDNKARSRKIYQSSVPIYNMHGK